MTRGGKPASASLETAGVPVGALEGACGTLESPGAGGGVLAAGGEPLLLHQFLVDRDRCKFDIFVLAGVSLLARYRLKARRIDPTDRAFGTTDNAVWKTEGTDGAYVVTFEDGLRLECPSSGWCMWPPGGLEAAHPEWFVAFPTATMPAEGDISDEVLPARRARKPRKPPVAAVSGTGASKVTAPLVGEVSRAPRGVQGTLELI